MKEEIKTIKPAQRGGRDVTEAARCRRCLCVRAPYAGQIVTGRKTGEYRTRPTNIRGIIGIIESGTGTIIGEAELYDCTEQGDWDYVWHLRNARRYKTPVPYVHPFGAVVWVRVLLQDTGGLLN